MARVRHRRRKASAALHLEGFH
jgi:hypothetical protein